MAEVRLLKSWSSPFSQRVEWALSLKGVEYEAIDEDLTSKSPSLLEFNPVHKKIPVLLHNGQPVCESLVILEYIDETWEQNPLLPQDPYEKAQARFWAKFGDEKLLQSLRPVLVTPKGKELDEALVAAKENLNFIEKYLEGRKFFGGERIGYLDLALGWTANLIPVLEIIIDVKVVDPEEFPKLSAWMHNFSNAPKIKELCPPQDRLISKYQAMAEALAAGSK